MVTKFKKSAAGTVKCVAPKRQTSFWLVTNKKRCSSLVQQSQPIRMKVLSYKYVLIRWCFIEQRKKSNSKWRSEWSCSRTLARLILYNETIPTKKQPVPQYLFVWWGFNSEVNWCFLPRTQRATREETLAHITQSPWGDYSSWLPYTWPCMQST